MNATAEMLPLVRSRSEAVAAAAIVALCVFSVVNPLIAQAAFFLFPHPVGGLNAMQWFQGLCFPVVLATLPMLPSDGVELFRPFSRLLWAYTIALGVLHLRLLLLGRLPTDMVNTERIVYFKMVFALLLLYYASCLVRSHDSARRLLRSILLGALITAGWVILCYVFGIGGAHYEADGVTATAGSDGVSGKAVAGFLLPAAAGAMYLGLREGSCRWALGATLLLAAVFVTFDRSAQVALLAGASWMVIWWVGLARPRPYSRAVIPFLLVIGVLGSTYFIHHGSEELTARWTRDFDRGEIGSGRGAFYATAWNWYLKESSTAEFLLGMGFGNIYALMYTGSGIYRHTHSDLFDMLLIGGIVGLALYFLLFHVIASLAKGLPVGSAEFATVGALLISFGVMSLLTGLMAFPHTVYTFGAQCICIRVLALEELNGPPIRYHAFGEDGLHPVPQAECGEGEELMILGSERTGRLW